MKLSSRIILIYLLFISCAQRNYDSKSSTIAPCEISVENKINGVSYTAMPYAVDSSNFQSVVDIHANWVAIMPFGFIRNNSSEVIYNTQHQWYGETFEGTKNYINSAKQKGLKVLLKPHLWIWNQWVGDLTFASTNDWENFASTYSQYILDYAKIADSLHVDMFSVGVELRNVAKNKPEIFEEIIDSVRNVYSGKLTYSANWDNYKNIPFWNKLDYIGIDAYFPLTELKSPTYTDYFNGWKSIKTDLKEYSIKYNKPVLFTEFGYRNIDYNGKEPWNDKENGSNNVTNQSNALQALYCNFWNESWFAGGFLWKWFPHHSEVGGAQDNQFTPQNKPAENIIKQVYGKE